MHKTTKYRLVRLIAILHLYTTATYTYAYATSTANVRLAEIVSKGAILLSLGVLASLIAFMNDPHTEA